MARGTFISLDGVDGAGKSTQARLLADWLRGQGLPVATCRDPGGTTLGDRVRGLLLDGRDHIDLTAEMLLYMASRAQLVAEVIRPALERGETVFCDRFLLANVVYQGHAGGLPPETVWEVGRVATGGLLPDLTLVLDLPPAAALERKGGLLDRMESRGAAFLERVRAGFLTEAARQPHSVRVISADRPVEAVQADLRQEVARVLGTRPRA
jgi:dTMP kinase